MMEEPLESESEMCHFDKSVPRDEPQNVNAGFTRFRLEH